MVIHRQPGKRLHATAGALTTELVIAMAILATVMLPLAFSFANEQALCRAYYYQAVAMELIDGEMEALAAGEWKAFSEGAQDYAVTGAAAQALPAGRFVLTIDAGTILLEWLPAKKGKGGRVAREIKLKAAPHETAN
jgi:hypothetical protein